MTAAARKTAARAISPDMAARIIVQSLMARRAAAHVLVGRDAKLIAMLKHWLPASWFDAILMREFGIANLPALSQCQQLQA